MATSGVRVPGTLSASDSLAVSRDGSVSASTLSRPSSARSSSVRPPPYGVERVTHTLTQPSEVNRVRVLGARPDVLVTASDDAIVRVWRLDAPRPGPAEGRLSPALAQAFENGNGAVGPAWNRANGGVGASLRSTPDRRDADGSPGPEFDVRAGGSPSPQPSARAGGSPSRPPSARAGSSPSPQPSIRASDWTAPGVASCPDPFHPRHFAALPPTDPTLLPCDLELRGLAGTVGFALDVEPRGVRVAAGSSDGLLALWDLGAEGVSSPSVDVKDNVSSTSGPAPPHLLPTWRVRAHGGDAIADVSFDAPWRTGLLASGGDDGAVCVWDVRLDPRGGEALSVGGLRFWGPLAPLVSFGFPGPEEECRALGWCPRRAGLLAAGSSKGTVQVWDLRWPQEVAARDVGPNASALLSHTLVATTRKADEENREDDPDWAASPDAAVTCLEWAPAWEEERERESMQLAEGREREGAQLGKGREEDAERPRFAASALPDPLLLAAGDAEGSVFLWDVTGSEAEERQDEARGEAKELAEAGSSGAVDLDYLSASLSASSSSPLLPRHLPKPAPNNPDSRPPGAALRFTHVLHRELGPASVCDLQWLPTEPATLLSSAEPVAPGSQGAGAFLATPTASLAAADDGADGRATPGGGAVQIWRPSGTALDSLPVVNGRLESLRRFLGTGGQRDLDNATKIAIRD